MVNLYFWTSQPIRREKNDIECQYRQNWLTPCSHHERWLQNENEARCNKHIIRIPNRVFGANSSPVSWKEDFFYSCISLTFPMTCAPCYQMICFKNPFRFLWEKERIKIVLLQNLPHFLRKKAFYIRVSVTCHMTCSKGLNLAGLCPHCKLEKLKLIRNRRFHCENDSNVFHPHYAGEIWKRSGQLFWSCLWEKSYFHLDEARKTCVTACLILVIEPKGCKVAWFLRENGHIRSVFVPRSRFGCQCLIKRCRPRAHSESYLPDLYLGSSTRNYHFETFSRW